MVTVHVSPETLSQPLQVTGPSRGGWLAVSVTTVEAAKVAVQVLPGVQLTPAGLLVTLRPGSGAPFTATLSVYWAAGGVPPPVGGGVPGLVLGGGGLGGAPGPGGGTPGVAGLE